MEPDPRDGRPVPFQTDFRIVVERGPGRIMMRPTMDWLLAPHNSVFAVAFVILVGLAVLEGISLLFGLGVSEWLSDLAGLDGPPDVPDAPDADAGGDGGGHSGSAGFPAMVLTWLEVGKVPLLVTLSVFLAVFSIGGMTLQQALVSAGANPLPQWLASVPALVVALPALKAAHRLLGRVWPKDETSSFPAEALIGRVGVVTIGTATPEMPAEVKVTGPDRRHHYVMVLLDSGEVPQGGEVVLLRRDGRKGIFLGTANTNPDMSPSVYS